ncbi:lipid II:glycine glycyltransferase FemX [Pseudonocardia spinosispora]|uniref:lipid II:glycine glycyltransferase FemX n=1 Tax=Pseudonocardia spinosispora TaxID=103441 RepID=UPI00041B7FEB|nr:GNAT family N-acetyltransferase [Pseudonocardia spinosispora]
MTNTIGDLALRSRRTARSSVTISAAPGAAALAEWDHLVAESVNSDVAQLSAWAVVRGRAGYRPLYVFAWSDGRLVGGAMVLRRRVRGLGWIGYLPYGPLFHATAEMSDCRERLVESLVAVAGEHAALFVQPPDDGAPITDALLANGFRRSRAGIAPAVTMRVDLHQSEETLRGNLNRRLRTWTRQWPQRGVKVRVGTVADIPTLATLAEATADYQGFTPFPSDYLETLYRELAPGGHVVLLIGEIDGVPVAAELLTVSGGVVKSRITGMDRTNPEAGKLNVASAMIWEAMLWGRDNRCHAFDFGGLRAESAQAFAAQGTVSGPDQFKAKFGGQVWTYPLAVELIRSRPLRAGYDLLHNSTQGERLLSVARRLLRGARK